MEKVQLERILKYILCCTCEITKKTNHGTAFCKYLIVIISHLEFKYGMLQAFMYNYINQNVKCKKVNILSILQQCKNPIYSF